LYTLLKCHLDSGTAGLMKKNDKKRKEK